MTLLDATAHESARQHGTGEAIYIDDMPAPQGMLVARAVTSPHAHARILRRDASAALALPGVHAVLFADDVPGENNVGPVFHDEPLFAADEVFCVGQPVAVVIGESLDVVAAAIARVDVDYEPLPARVSLDQAIEEGVFHGDEHVIARGDASLELAQAPHRLAGVFRSGGQDHFYLETQVALAVPGEANTVMIHSSTQHPSEVQTLVAETLGWGRNRVTVECPRMGGAFGGKETQAAQFACMAALGAQVTGRPVKVWLDRDTDMITTGRRHPFRTDWEVGFDEDGRILALQADLYADGGWASDLSLSILDRGMFHLDNCYWLPVVRITGRVGNTHKTSNTAFRGFGGPQGMVVIEHVMEHVASALGVDALAVRKANFYSEGSDRTPYGQHVDDFRAHYMVDELVASSGLLQRQTEIEAYNASHTWRKRAISLTPLKFGISFTASFLNQAGAFVLIYADGTVQLNHGGTEMGQGLYTKMLAVCAYELGIEVAQVRHMNTRTDKVPNTSATAASCGSDLNGMAVRDACQQLATRLIPVAAEMLGVDPSGMSVAANAGAGPDGAWAWTDDVGVSFAQVCQAAYMGQIQLSAAGYYRTPDISYDRKRGQGKPFHYYAYGAAVSEVELNGLTGEWKLLRVDILHDVGDSLSPDVDRGQVEGGFLQGLGWLTMEELVYRDDGFLLTHSPSTYKIPAIGDAPADFRVSLLEHATQHDTIHGSKAVGEPPFMLAISSHIALCRAAAAFGADRYLQVDAPATVEALLFAVERARE
jgi:xanthine dehydrogenase large subunit